MSKDYNDKWKKFMKRSLRNIDYLTRGISDEILDEIMFSLELVSINEDTFLFKAGNVCKDIYSKTYCLTPVVKILEKFI